MYREKEVGNNMNTLTYNLPNDIHTYVMTCNDELEFTSYADYVQWKNEK